MSTQPKRKQAELFMQYPPLWDQAQRLIRDGKLPAMNIRVTRADTVTMDYRLRATTERSHAIAMSGPFAGLRGVAKDVLLAVNANHKVLGVLYGTPRLESIHIRDIFSIANHERVDYLLLLDSVKWHNEPTPEQRDRDVTLGEWVANSLDAYVLRRPTKTSWLELRDQAEALRKEKEEAYLYPPKQMPELDGIEQALKAGARLRVFLSGGGLRVVLLAKGDQSVGYGEHPDITEALRHASEDFLAGGRKYQDVYGEGKLYTHHLTGSSTAASNLDHWVLQGHSMNAKANRRRDGFVVQLEGTERVKHPEGVNDRVLAGETVVWEDRGFTYESSPSRLANGDACITTQVVGVPEGADPRDDWMYYVKKVGTGQTFWEAALAALAATPVPLKRS